VQEYPLNGFDIEARKFVLDQYKLRGMNFHGLSSPTKITKGPNGKLTVTVEPYEREGDAFDIEGVDEVGGSGQIFACLKPIAARDIALWQETAEALDHHDGECQGAISTGDVAFEQYCERSGCMCRCPLPQAGNPGRKVLVWKRLE
jgi:hypothetical protein